MTNTAGGDRVSRGLELSLFATAMLWAATASVIAGRAAAGISGRLRLSYGQTLLESLFLLFLAVLGFQVLDRIAMRGKTRGEALPLPRRNTAGREWGTGVAVGWGLCLAAVLPVSLSGHLHGQWSRGPGVAPAIASALGTLLVVSLAEETIFRGYPFQRLMSALSPAWAAVLMSLLFAAVLVYANPPLNLGGALLDGALFGAVLAMAYLRTHALWLGWGLHFSYRAVMAVVLGLPIVGRSDFGALVDAYTTGPRWLSGGAFGLDAALLTMVVMLIGLVVLYRLTRDWAWAYTLPEIVPAGYEVTVAPPPAHVAMERLASPPPPPPLVQILPATPQGFAAAEAREDVDRPLPER
jgi:membrane protease YdiL (CAAX protease family)